MTLLLARPAAAQTRPAAAQTPTFEYGQLVVLAAAGDWSATWITADSVVKFPALPEPKSVVAFNKLGSLGWEFVMKLGEDRVATIYLFKRRHG
jgi:hypothetical protein